MIFPSGEGLKKFVKNSNEMKNILVYINPQKRLDNQSEILFKIQIDNSYELGWKKEDILFITNFDYEYNGIRSAVIGDEYYCDYSPISTKISAIVGAFKQGLLKDDLYWLHDLDAFQSEAITESEVNMDRWDMAICDFGRLMKWSGGSIFFKNTARDIFEKTNNLMYKKRLIDEQAMTEVSHNDEKIYNRIKKMNISYNLVPFNIRTCYKMAIKPLKVVHFNPFEGVRQLKIASALDFYKGNNKINTPLISQRLLKIFERYGIS